MATALGKKRVVGLILLVGILAVFLSFNRFPKLDTVREDLDTVSGPQTECFQGFCIERDPESSFLERWWDFSIEYLNLVTIGMIFAFAVAGLAEGFLFPSRGGGAAISGGQLSRTLKGLAAGPVMNLCSACVVPVAAAFRRRGGGIEGTLAMVHGSSTLNLPALVMATLVFTPVLGVSRVLLSLLAALAIGPIVAKVVSRSEDASDPVQDAIMASEAPDERPWGPVMREAFADWGRSSLRFIIRMGPIMIAAGFASGFAIQWVSPDSIAEYLGNDMRGVAIAATLGILINVPLLFEIPLVALLLILGMGPAPAATLLFTAAAGGPITFWGLSSVMPKRAIGALATSTWVIGLVGGLGILAYGVVVSEVGETLRIETTEAAVGSSIVLTEPWFVDATETSNVAFLHHDPNSQQFPLGAGVVVFDFNGDIRPDIYFPDMRGSNALYRNEGDGTFTEVAALAGVDNPEVEGNGGCAADYDNDGDLDLYATNHGTNALYRNNGDETFTDVAPSTMADYDAKRRFTGCAWGDYDRDGNVDLIVVSHMGEVIDDVLQQGDFYIALRGMTLFHNEGDGTFANATDLLGDTSGAKVAGDVGVVYGAGFQPAWVDYDNDGDSDLYVVNDIGRQIQPNVLWRNDGDGPDGRWQFKDVSKETGTRIRMDGMGLAIGDYDLDGSLDFFITNINSSVMLQNGGDGPLFTRSASESATGVGMLGLRPRIGWGTVFLDYDNDGDEDLYVVSGFLDIARPSNDREQPNALLRNEKNGGFVEVSTGSGADDTGVGRGGAYIDFNGDGCVDLVFANYGQTSKLLENVCDSGNHWLIVDLEGTTSNRDGIGARITVTADGAKQIRETSAGGSSMGQNMMEAHFGLGKFGSEVSVSVRWPSGKIQELSGVSTDRRIQVVEPE